MVTWFGADWDKNKCVVAFEQGGRMVRKHVMRHPKAVGSFLAAHCDGDGVVGIESGDALWAELWRQGGAEVHVFDGKKARRFAESLCSSGASDDKRAADNLLAMVQSPRHRRDANAESPRSVRGMERLMRMSEDASKDAVRHENQLRDTLRQVHPAFADAVGRSLKSKWVLELLEIAPTPMHWNALESSAQVAALTKKKARQSAVMTALGEVWAPMDADEVVAAQLQVHALVRALREALARVASAKQALNDAVAEHDKEGVITSTLGIGPSLALAITIGMAATTDDRDSLAVSLGAAPVTRRSGTLGDARPHVHMRRAAAPAMRRSSYLIGWQLVGNYRWAKAQYTACRARGLRAAAAYRCVTRSFSRVVPALIKNNTPFDEERYLEGLKKQGVAWAQGL